MPEHRLINKSVIFEDRFARMEHSPRELYLYLLLSSDDEGFVDSSEGTCRQMRMRQKSIEDLISNGFLIRFDSGVLLIADWPKHDKLKPNMIKKTKYVEEASQVVLDKARGIYRLKTASEQGEVNAPQKEDTPPIWQEEEEEEQEQDSISQDNTTQYKTSQYNTSQYKTSQVKTSQDNTSQYNTTQYKTSQVKTRQEQPLASSEGKEGEESKEATWLWPSDDDTTSVSFPSCPPYPQKDEEEVWTAGYGTETAPTLPSPPGEPSKEEVVAYAKLQELTHVDIDHFYQYFSSLGWRTKAGTPVRWKLRLKDWEERDRKKEAMHHDGSFDTDDFFNASVNQSYDSYCAMMDRTYGTGSASPSRL